jgi:hypothetical protein
VIVPHDKERVLTMNRLGVGIGLVLRVPGAVVGKGQNLRVGNRDAPDSRAVTESSVLVLVDVVAEVQDRVEIRAIRERRVGVVLAARVVGTGHLAEA